MSFENVEVEDKRSALKDFIEEVCIDNAEDFVFYQEPKTQFLSIEDRMGQMDIMENSNGKVRMIEVFYNGPADGGNFRGNNIESLLRIGGEQIGAVSAFKVVVTYGVEKNSDGEIVNRNNFEKLMTGYNPRGMFPAVRETNNLKVPFGNKEKTVLLSGLSEPIVPASPKPLGSTSRSDGFAHYSEFRVFIQDM